MTDPSEVLDSADLQQSDDTFTSSGFEHKLIEQGFLVEPDFVKCNHQHTHTLFYQESTCCDEKVIFGYSNTFKKKLQDVTSIDFPWRKGDYCESCIDGRTGVLFCGGHYNNLRVFQGDKDISHEYENCIVKKPDPTELIYEDAIIEGYQEEFFIFIEDQFKENGGTSLCITDFDMSHEECMRILFEEIHDHPIEKLETLELKSCSLNPDHVWPLFVVDELSEYWPGLKTLDLSGNNIRGVPSRYQNSTINIKI